MISRRFDTIPMTKDLTPDFTIASKIVDESTKMQFGIIEQQFRIRIQPKPKWLPYKVWYWILGKMLVLDIFQAQIEDMRQPPFEWRDRQGEEMA